MNSRPQLSIVVPLYNEQEVFPRLIKELLNICGSLGKSFEIIFVDDGSRDRTFELIESTARSNPNVKGLSFSRNFGHQAAFNAGIDFASGDFVLTMDGDLQHPPRLIPDFLKFAENGYDIVIGERLYNKQNNLLREMLGKKFYKLLSFITGLEFRNVSDFALYSRSVVSVIKRLPERERYLRGIIQWVGFRKKYIPYVAEERKGGSPKYTIKKLVGLVLSGVTSFSAFPLRLSFWLGLVILLGSLIFGMYVVMDHYLNPNPFIAGWATVVLLILFSGSVQLMVLGIIGEYLYKMFNEVKGRPLYIVSATRNLEERSFKDTPYGIGNYNE